MPTPEVSVVVSTYQRAGALPGLFESLEAQTLDRDRFEVVLVDNGTTDETASVLDDLVRSSPLHVRVERLARNRGPAAGREAGVRAARAPIIALTDDDCRPSAGWLEVGLETMHAGAIVMAGPVLPPPDAEIGPFSRVVWIDDARFLATSNVFYWREDLLAVGGFDERYGSVGGEDTDLGLRVLERHGLREAAFRPDALVVHPVTPSSLAGALRVAWRWHDLPLLFKRYPRLRDELAYLRFFWKASHPRAILALGAIVLAVMAVLIAVRSVAAGLGLGGLAAILAAPWLRQRLFRDPITPGWRDRLLTLPGALLVDLTEVVALLRGSLTHRTLLL